MIDNTIFLRRHESRLLRCLTIVILILTSGTLARCEDEGREVAEVPARAIDFENDIIPILQRSCLACHNESDTEGELILESVEQIMAGGDSGPAVVAGDASESILFQLAAHQTEPVMPPVDNDVDAKPLTPEQLALLKGWIDQGAKDSEADGDADDAIDWKPVPAGHAPVYALDVSADGAWLAAGRGNQLLVYSIAGRRQQQVLVDSSIAATHPDSAHLDIVQSVAISPDGRTIATGGFRNVKVWRQQWDLSLPAAEPSETLRAYLDKTPDKELPVPKDQIVDQDVSPDGKRLLIVSDAGRRTILYSLPDHKVIREFDGSVFSHRDQQGHARSVGLQQERLRVAKADVAAAEKRQQDDEKNAKRATEELEKAKAEQAKQQQALEQKDKAKREASETLKQAEQRVVQQEMQLAKSKQELAEADEQAKSELETRLKQEEAALASEKKSVQQAKAATKKANEEHKKQQGATDAASKAVSLADNAKQRADAAVALRKEELATAVEQRDLVQKAVETAEQNQKQFDDQRKAQPSLFQRVAFLADSWRAVLIDQQGDAVIVDATQGHVLDIATIDGEGQLPGTWQLTRVLGGPKQPEQFKNRVTALAFSPNAGQLAIGGGDPSRSGELQLWNTSDWSHQATIDDVHSDVVYDLQFSPQPQSHRLASSGSDRMVKLVDTAAAKVLRAFEGHTGHVLGVAWRADGRTLATAGADKVVKVWDAVEGTQKKTISGFKTEVTAIRYLGLADRMAFSVGDGQVPSRDSNGSGKPGFGGFTDYVHLVRCSQDGQVVAAAGQDRVIRIWDGKGKLLVAFEPN